jgi:3-dehydroquinate dehydratase type II
MNRRTIAIINGPNINILGVREPKYYGKTTLPEITTILEGLGDELNYDILCYQSNNEGDIVDFIQEHSRGIAGLIINPAGFSKTGYSILDAITAYQLPFIEVHLSNIFAREKWHSESIFTPYSSGIICGFKARGYEFALQYLADILRDKEKQQRASENNIKAVCFDFDGVIIDSIEVQKEAFIRSYRKVVGNDNLPSVEEFFSHSGESLANIFRKMNLPQQMIEPYREISMELVDSIRIHDGMVQLLQQLKQQGIKCGLCTGKDRERTVIILKKLKLYQFFDAIVCSDEVKEAKPNPESLLKLMGLLGVNHKQAIMIGDSHNDIECAKSAFMPSIGVTWGEVDSNPLIQSKPDYLASTIQQLQFYISKF